MLQGFPSVDIGIIVASVAIAVPIIGLIAWFTRLESKTGTNERDIARLEKRQDDERKEIVKRQDEHETKLSDLNSKVMDKLSKIETIVANIQGQLSK